MNSVPVSRLSNEVLVCELRTSVAQDGPHTARQVELMAEVERRRLFAPAGYPSMFAFCIGELHLSEDAAYKRIRVARAARRSPRVLVALAEGHVHLSGLTLLAHYFNPAVKGTPIPDPAMVDELLTAATHKSRRQIERLLAERFPRPDVHAEVRQLPPPPADQVTALGVARPFERCAHAQTVTNTGTELAPGPVGDPVIPCPAPVASGPAIEYSRVAPLSPQRYGVQFTLDEAGHDLLRHVQDLLGHEVPRGDLAEVFVRALKAYAVQLERVKFAATERPRPPRRQKPGSRHVPAHVKRAVRKRDKGQCTHVSDSGRRCEARSDLEYDHVLEFARGGDSTVSNIRLRCRAHNQHTAERTYGAEFMRHKRAQAAAGQSRPTTTASSAQTPVP